MSEQYFTNNPNSEHNLKNFKFELLDENLSFTTDSGVFSGTTIDYGTRVMIDAFAAEIESVEAGERLLDAGCGYGPVGIAFAKAFGFKVEMIDVNERALSLARINADANGVAELVDIHTSDVYSDVHHRDFSAILTNPPVRAGKSVVNAMISESYDLLTDGGVMVVVLQKKQGAPSAKKLLEDVYGNCEILIRDKGYYVLQSIK
ncbi:MAG: methyltransferase [Lactobacillales bacterium]|jgi:16S rRNA (guanine1207-N2)-methyltransferase|nr:methyltransferase [Lactobacillales bacterium]